MQNACLGFVHPLVLADNDEQCSRKSLSLHFPCGLQVRMVDMATIGLPFDNTVCSIRRQKIDETAAPCSFKFLFWIN